MRGGRRPGAGRKPKNRMLRAIDGGASHRPTVEIPTTNLSGTAAIDEFSAPDSLLHEERQVWLQLAPHAFKNRTLTRATALAFERLCKYVVLERILHESDAERGGANHRGLISRVDAGLLRFNLAPCGKALYEAAPDEAAPVNPLDRFLKRAK